MLRVNLGSSCRFPLADGKRIEHTQSENDTKTAWQKQLEEVTANAVGQLTKFKKISSQFDVERILDILENLSEHFPYSCTPQKLTLVDSTSYRNYVQNHFVPLLNKLVDLFDHTFPLRSGKIYDGVAKVLSVENADFFEIALATLSSKLTEGKHKNIAACLETLLNSDALFVYLVMNLYKSNEESYRNTINLIVSLPTRIANIYEKDTPRFFANNTYSYILIYNVLKTIEFIALSIAHDSKIENRIHLQSLALFLSKIAIFFNAKTNCDGLNYFADVVTEITNAPCQKKHLYQNITRGTFDLLEQNSVETVAKLFLSRINPNKHLIKEVWGKKLASNPNWKHVLCKKIPLFTHFERDQDKIVTNLVVYLSTSSHGSLEVLLLNLLKLWSDRNVIKLTSVDQHLLLSKYIICIVNALRNMEFTEYEIEQVKKCVYQGMPIHLESSSPAVRYSGMKTGEYIINFLMEYGDPGSENRLNFEYDKINREGSDATSKLQHFIDLDFTALCQRKTRFELNLEQILRTLSHQNSITSEYIPPERIFRSRTQKEERENEVVVSDSTKVKNYGITILDDTFQIDSDDEFEPHDVSNDVPLPTKLPPAYLRDLKENLLETEDPEMFSLSIEHAESLITDQLPNDDAKIGLELLEILISLDCKFYVENFNEFVFHSCVAITSVYPIVYSDYLCKEIHAEVGKYSLVHRILMLDILRQTSKNISEIKPEEVTQTEPRNKKLKTEANKASEVIKKRLQSKTRYFHTHKSGRVEQKNKFSDIAGYFFFPLLYGYNQNKLLTQQLIKDDEDYLFLIHFIETLAIVMLCSQNCVITPRMAKEGLHFSWFMRFHKDAKVKVAVLHLIGSAITAVPEFILVNDFINELLEIRLWLAGLLNPNVGHGDPNEDVRYLAACTISIIENVLKNDVDET